MSEEFDWTKEAEKMDLVANDKVIPIEEGKKKKGRSGKPPDGTVEQCVEVKVPKVEIYREVASLINNDPRYYGEVFPWRWEVVENDDRSLQPGIVVDDVFSPLSIEIMSSMLTRWLTEHKDVMPDIQMKMTVGTVGECVIYWIRARKPIPQPIPVAVPGITPSGAICYCKVPWTETVDELVEKAPSGSLDDGNEFFERCGANRDALMLWTGSLFVPESNRQQYVWMFGHGQNGKSSFIRLLDWAFGRALSSEDSNQAVSQFWTAGLVGKRVVVFPDCNSYAFPISQKFKSVCGDDSIRCEEKGKSAYKAKIFCKFIFASNEKPTLSRQKSDTRRAIYVEPAEITCDPDPKYDERLQKNGKWILGACIGMYLDWVKKVGGHRPIPTDKATIEGLLSENEQGMQTDFDQWFKREPEGAEKKTARDRVYFTGREMNILMANARWKENQKRRFRKFIETSGISRMRVKDQDESVSWRYVGAELTNWAGHVVATYAGTSSGDED